MGEIIMRNWDLREFRVRGNLPSPIQQVRVPIRRVITPIQGLPNPIRQGVPLISHIRSYPLYWSHHHPHLSHSGAQLYHLCRTQSQCISLYLSMSWSWVYTEYSIHRAPAYTEYKHTPSTRIHHVQVVLATGLGSLPAVRVLTSSLVRFGSRPGEKPDPLCLGGFVTLAAVPLVPFLHLSLKLSIWVLIVSWHDQYVDCAFLAALSLPAVRFAIGPIFVELLQNNA